MVNGRYLPLKLFGQRQKEFWLLQTQKPQKQLLKQRAKPMNLGPPESPEKPLHRMGRKHRLRLTFNDPGVTFITFEFIKLNQMTACTLQKKAKQLFENLPNGLTFATLPYPPKQRLYLRLQGNSSKIPYKQTQSTPACYGLGGEFNTINNVLALDIFLCYNGSWFLPPNRSGLWSIISYEFTFIYHKF